MKLLSDYSWKRAELERLEIELNDMRNDGYIPDATKGRRLLNIKSMESTDSTSRRLHKRIKQYREDTLFIEEIERNTPNELHQTIIRCLMDGMEKSDISKHLNISRSHLYNLIKIIVQNEMKRQEMLQSC